MTDISANLKKLNIELPTPGAPVASYVPYVITGNTLYISGQLPRHKDASGADSILKGCMGAGSTLDEGQQAARVCAINILAVAKMAVDGDLSRLKRLVKLGGFVASTGDYFDHPKVINGASDLMLDILGDAGKHARFALGVSALPFGALVEIDAVFEIA